MSVNDFCLLCGNETKTEIICNSTMTSSTTHWDDPISNVCDDLVVDSVCSCVTCVLCVVCLVFLRKCVRGHGYVGGYELAAV